VPPSARDAAIPEQYRGGTNTASAPAMNSIRIGILSSLLLAVSACSGEAPGSTDSPESVQQKALMLGACPLPPVNLRSAAQFAVLAGATVTNTGLTIVDGDLGVSPGTAVTGFLPGKIVGSEHRADPTSATAEQDLTVAYDDAAGRVLCPVSLTGNLGGMTLAPGLYKSTSGFEISSGDLTLDAKGDASAVFLFQMASTFVTTVGRQVILKGGATASNVFWQVGSSATVGAYSSVEGTIMANQSVSVQTGAVLNGRALARIGAVTLESNSVTLP
jgi:hypothetical protein